MPRRWQTIGLALLAVVALACEGANGTTPTPTKGSKAKVPASIAALGDSITAGFGSCFSLVACSRNSWSTGSGAAVDSHYKRIRESNPKAKGRNFAQSGAEASALAGQAAEAVDMKAEYVTILIGANDACADRLTGMTPTARFRDQVDAGLRTLKRGLPRARVLVVSIPDLHRLWELGRGDARAVRAWNRRSVCPTMLAAPTSTAAADDKRRDQVGDRIDDYNDELRKACRAYGKKCRWDGGSAHRVRFSLDMVNEIDFFHPNAAGQNKLADATYPSRFTW